MSNLQLAEHFSSRRDGLGQWPYWLVCRKIQRARRAWRSRSSRAGAGGREAEYRIRFAVCGMSHDHIYGVIGAVQRGLVCKIEPAACACWSQH